MKGTAGDTLPGATGGSDSGGVGVAARSGGLTGGDGSAGPRDAREMARMWSDEIAALRIATSLISPSNGRLPAPEGLSPIQTWTCAFVFGLP